MSYIRYVNKTLRLLKTC